MVAFDNGPGNGVGSGVGGSAQEAIKAGEDQAKIQQAKEAFNRLLEQMTNQGPVIPQRPLPKPY